MKFYDDICFVTTKETSPGIWEEVESILKYSGDVIRRSSQYRPSQSINDNIQITNEISIVADQFALNNFFSLRWIQFCGVKWKVTNVDVQPPRLILSTGDIYND